MTHVWDKRLTRQETTYVCSKRAPWAKPTARMSKGGEPDPPEGHRPSVLRQGSGASKFYAVGPLRGPAGYAGQDI